MIVENAWEEEREKCSVLEMEMRKVGDVKGNRTNGGERKRSEEIWERSHMYMEILIH
jgi:hypothetical protein